MPELHLQTESDEPSELTADQIAFSVPAGWGLIDEDKLAARAAMLTRVADAIQSVCELDELLATFLNAIIDVFGPDRGAVLLYEEEDTGQVLKAKVVRPENAGARISRSIVDYAIENQASVMVPNTAQDERFADAQSVADLSIRAAICCPLICRGRVLGALYLDSQVQITTSETDLAVLNVVASNAAMAIENAILIRDKLAASAAAGQELGPMVAHSEAMQDVSGRVARPARDGEPLLITGEAGAGKLFVARTIHRASGDPGAPLIEVDCRTVEAEAQADALFGRAAAQWASGPAAEGGSLRNDRGLLFLAHGGMLVLRHVGALAPESQRMLEHYLQQLNDRAEFYPCVRVVATTTADLDAEVEADRFLPALARRLLANALAVPPLRERGADILPLARHFLAAGGSAQHEYRRSFNGSAEHALSKLQYRHANARELREAIDLAALMADGPEISAEHIFTGPKGGSRKLEFDLSDSPIMRLVVHGRLLGAIKYAILALFSAIAVFCIAARGTTAGRVANGMVWGLWWPSLMVLFLVLGRLWCPFCPISLAGRTVKRILHFDLKPPQWLKKHSSVVGTCLLLAIVWSEQVFHMPSRPLATGMFLLTLMACSVALCALYQREVWCRYMCPLGGISAAYSLPAPVRVHATAAICASQCKTHECSKGADAKEGCPVFLHPLYVRDAHLCKLCFECLRTCPHQSARPYFGLYLQSIWSRDDINASLTPFCIAGLFLMPLMLASQNAAYGGMDAAAVTAGVAIVIAATFALNRVLPALLSRDRDATVAARVAAALFVLGWGPFMAFHLRHIPGLAALHIQSAGGPFITSPFPVTRLPVLGILQFAVVALSALLAAVTLIRIRSHATRQGVALVAWGWRALFLLCGMYCLAVTALLLAPQGM